MFFLTSFVFTMACNQSGAIQLGEGKLLVEEYDTAISPDNDLDGFDNSVDCDDYNNTIYPGADEIIDNGVDDNCDGYEHCYQDADGDHFNNSSGAIILSDDLDCEDFGEGSNSNPLTDCNDTDNTIHPDATEISNDGIDQDCDEQDLISSLDSDNDSFENDVDCNDNDPTIYPGAVDIPNDAIDQDCDGQDATMCPQDQMFDCFANCFPTTWLGDGYCDEGLASFQGNWISLDCQIHNFDNGDCIGDTDNDGFDELTDCDDNDPTIYPGADDIPFDNIDQDCDGQDATMCPQDQMFDCFANCFPTTWLGDGYCDEGLGSFQGNWISLDCQIHNFDNGDCALDNDGDGFDETVDCNDNDPTIYPGAMDIPNDAIDQDCSGQDAT